MGGNKALVQGQKSALVEFRAPQDPAAWTRPCLLCTSCTCSESDYAGRCSPLRTPCMCSFSERAGRCSPLRTPCIRSFSEHASRCSTQRTPCTGSFADYAGRCWLLLRLCSRCSGFPFRARFLPPLLPPPPAAALPADAPPASPG